MMMVMGIAQSDASMTGLDHVLRLALSFFPKGRQVDEPPTYDS